MTTLLHKTRNLDQFSRSKLEERKHVIDAQNCHQITEYVQILNEIDVLSEEKDELKFLIYSIGGLGVESCQKIYYLYISLNKITKRTSLSYLN